MPGLLMSLCCLLWLLLMSAKLATAKFWVHRLLCQSRRIFGVIFFAACKKRNLHGVRLFVSDAHEGLKVARSYSPAFLGRALPVPSPEKLSDLCAKEEDKERGRNRHRNIFNAPTVEEAQRLLNQLLERYQKSAPRLASWAETNIPEGPTVFQFSSEHRRRIRAPAMFWSGLTRKSDAELGWQRSSRMKRRACDSSVPF